MDDGIELNFAAPSGSAVRQVASSKKGGRWTDRVKARREAKDSTGGRPREYAQTLLTSAAPARAPAPARPTLASAPASSTPAPIAPPRPRPVDPPVARPPPQAARPPVPRPTPAPVSRPTPSVPVFRPAPSTQAARPAPVQSSSPAKKAAPVARPAPRPSYTQPTAGPSTASTQSSSKTPGIISSLFTSNPARPPTTKSAKPAPAYSGLPSNAPLAGDTSTFEGLGLDPLLTRHLKGKMGVERPTGIQRSALPYMLASPLDIDKRTDLDEDEDGVKQEEPEEDLRDIFIQSQTGSGKTLTYLLPIVQTLLPLSRLSYIDRSIGTLGIILAPTRELAQQISKVLEQLLSLSLSSEDDDEQYTRWLVSGLLTGGSTRTHEKARLRKGVPILVSTPGRLLDHLQNTTSFKCAKTMFLVLDEADRLMDLGFEETIHGIIRALEGRRKNEIAGEKEMDEAGGGVMRWAYWSRGRRTVLCSATADAKVEKLAGNALRNPITFRAEPEIPKTNPKTELKVQEAMEDANAITLPMADEEKFTPPSQLSQKYVVVPTKLRLVSLVATLRSLISAAKGEGLGTKIIVFLSSTDAVDFHWKLLGGVQMGEPEPQPEATIEDEDEDDDGESADDDDAETSAKPKPTPKPVKKPKAKPQEELIALTSALFPKTTIHRLHGSLPLRTRLASLSGFSASSPTHSILLATSVASRGLDLPLVRAVVQYDLPTEGGANEYVHRVGRTARAGKGGEAWSFVGPSEEAWVEWVQGKMGKAESKGVKLSPVTVDDVLKKGFGGKGWEYEQRATDVQLGFERWVLSSDQNATLARRAFSSYIRAYSTHPAEEKRFFHPKSLHLGHLAKSFALREAPSSLTSSGPKPSKPTTSSTTNNNKRKRAIGANGRGGDADSDDEDTHGGKEKTARNETEARMYAAVRKAGKQIRSQGKMGQFGGGAGDSEFQIVGADDVERMVSDRRR